MSINSSSTSSSSSSNQEIVRPIVPDGLGKLIDECLNIYPDQPNPLQVTTILKYWYLTFL